MTTINPADAYVVAESLAAAAETAEKELKTINTNEQSTWESAKTAASGGAATFVIGTNASVSIDAAQAGDLTIDTNSSVI